MISIWNQTPATESVTAYTLALQDSCQNRENIGCRLSGARLCLAQHVLAIQCQRNGLALYERRLQKALLRDSLHQPRVESQVGKGRFFFCSLGLAGRLSLGLRRGHAVLVKLSFHGCHLSRAIVARWMQSCVVPEKYMPVKATPRTCTDPRKKSPKDCKGGTYLSTRGGVDHGFQESGSRTNQHAPHQDPTLHSFNST